MRPVTKFVIQALENKRQTRRQIQEEINYSRPAVRYALAVLKATDQVIVVDPDALTPVYQLTGPVCPHCGQVIR